MTIPIVASGKLFRLDPQTGTLRTRTYQLTVVDGPDRGKALAFTGTVTVGCHPDASICLSDPTVSRFHVELEPMANGVRVRDLNSRNGTFISTARVQEAMIEGETVLTLGNSALEVSILEQDIGRPEGPTSFGGAMGESKGMRQLFGILERVSPTDTTIVLCGETGTGKEVLAQAIHQASARKDRPFVVLDCGAIAPTLIESELFGHVKGAFTGATDSREGAFLAADGGTIFLDEIGELPVALQPKLLRVLESGTVKRLGENKSRRINVRVVAATHRELEAEVAAGRFRADLYYRLAVVLAHVPPLRSRVEDLPMLTRHFISRMGRPDFELSEAVKQRFASYSWPGNVRELRNFVERALAGADPIPVTRPGAEEPRRPSGEALADLPFKEAKEKLLDSFVKEYIETLLERCSGNISEVARVAGVQRTYVHRLVAKYGLREGS